MDYDVDFYRRKQELMQKVYILKNELTPQEKAAMQDMKSSLQQAWVVRAIPCVLFGYSLMIGIPRTPAKIPKLLKSLNIASHLYALTLGVGISYGLIPKQKIVTKTLQNYNITMEQNLGKLRAMEEEERSCSAVPNYSFDSVQKAYNEELKKTHNQVRTSQNRVQKTEDSQEPDDGFEDFYAKKRGRRTNTYGDELDSD
ncbi:uncharacterized protein LOC125681612 [Ostrea edulis]|uniref:uncharacterized protein LOC125681612 n=1 Tax=Ostrea edulis TaxID=37623 RepID=UPI002094F99D|nr:uncharacterized protein LOC125681612 [Ostrea edulis]